MPRCPFSKTWAGLYNLKRQIIIACTNAVCVCASVCARRWLWLIFNPFLLFQLSCEAHCLRSISYCKLIIFCWNCISVCVHMCVFECLLCMHLLCYCKQNDMAQYYFPSTISRHHACFLLSLLNASAPRPLQMHPQCQSHFFEFGRRRAGDGGRRQGWRLQGGYSSLTVAC